MAADQLNYLIAPKGQVGGRGTRAAGTRSARATTMQQLTPSTQSQRVSSST